MVPSFLAPRGDAGPPQQLLPDEGGRLPLLARGIGPRGEGLFERRVLDLDDGVRGSAHPDLDGAAERGDNKGVDARVDTSLARDLRGHIDEAHDLHRATDRDLHG